MIMASAATAVGSLSVEGADSVLESAIRGYVEPAIRVCGDAAETAEFQDKIQRLTQRAFDSTGHFAARAEISLQQGCKWRVVTTQTGLMPVSVWNLRYTGADSPQMESPTSYKSGDTFVPTEYERGKRNLLSRLNSAGYLDARYITSSVQVDVEARTVAIDWLVDAGERYTVRNLLIDQSTLSSTLFERYLALEPGGPLVQQDVLQTYENLSESEYFSRVRVQPQMDGRADGEIDVAIETEPASRWSVLGGVGFATDSGPRVRSQADARYLNEHGHRLSISSLLAPVLGHAKAEYRWPYGDPTHQWYAVESRYSYEDTDTAESDTISIGIRRLTRLGKRWTQTLYSDYLSEQFDISTQDRRSQLVVFGHNLSYSTSIDTARPRLGTRFSLDVRGASEVLASDTDVLQLRLQAKQILPFFGQSRWILRADVGATWQSEFDELPASMRFFAGGDKSVRGFGLDTLGPEDELGEVIGGRRLLAGSAELDVPVREKWSLAFFTDVGSAYDSTPEFSQSVGVGVRWYSPLGPIRLDLAHPLEDSSQSVRVHISIGPDL